MDWLTDIQMRLNNLIQIMSRLFRNLTYSLIHRSTKKNNNMLQLLNNFNNNTMLKLKIKE